MELRQIELGEFLDTVAVGLPWPRSVFEEWARKNCEKGEDMTVTDRNARYFISRESILRYFKGECGLIGSPKGRSATTVFYNDPADLKAKPIEPDPEKEDRLNRILAKVTEAVTPTAEAPAKPKKRRTFRRKK